MAGMAATSVEQINAALTRYYQLMGVPYKDQFTSYCEDNGLDDMNDEMAVDSASDCLLIEFDEDIPFKSEPSDKTQAVFDLLLKICHNPNCDFQDEDNAFKSLRVSAADFKITRDDIAMVKSIHEAQLTTIWNGDIQRDKNILAILAISRNLLAPYLTYLVDLFNRDRVVAFTRPQSSNLTEMAWSNKSKHCRELKELKPSYADTIKHGVLSFFHRICPKLTLKSPVRIVDSLPAVAQYIKAQIDLVHLMTQERRSTCPFQLDASIVFGNVRKEEEEEEEEDDDFDDEDDDYDYDDEQQLNDAPFVDLIGNVKYRLKYGKLLHEIGVMGDNEDEKSNLEPSARIVRRFHAQFRRFKQKLIEHKGKQYEEYPRNHRFCSLIDRRTPNDANAKYEVRKEDEIIFYEPPNNCNRIPNQDGPEVDLWYFDSSKTCILPTSNKDGVHINSGQSVKGAMLVLSFHVLSVHEIRAYLYWNAQVLRFFPEDVMNLLPQFFVDNEVNRAFDGSVAARKMVADMKKKLRDKKFEAFYKTYGAKR